MTRAEYERLRRRLRILSRLLDELETQIASAENDHVCFDELRRARAEIDRLRVDVKKIAGGGSNEN